VEELDMNELLKEKEQILAKDDDNVIIFPKPDREALGPKDPNDPNWLMGLPKETKFLVQNKMQTNDFALGEFEILAKRKDSRAVLLHSDINQEITTWVDSLRFCRIWALYSILQMGEQEEE
jgi:hypothetical protein